MVSHLQQKEPHLQNPIFLLDALYCKEDHFEEDREGSGFETLKKTVPLLEHDLSWEDNELVRLLCKEKETHFGERDLGPDGFLMVARKDAVEWILRVNAYYGFSAVTAVLGVNYLDRFISRFCFQGDKPWMGQLAAVACVSLAAKVEETHVPLLLDLQVEETKYVFEAKTIQRMELLVLSTLQWKMNPVTPFSYIDHIIRRFGLHTHIHWEFLQKCEHLLLSVINDARIVCYLPSVIATATMLLVMKEVKHCDGFDYQDQIRGVLNISKEKVAECCALFMEQLDKHGHKQSQAHNRKYRSMPGSPNGVIDMYFSCDSSNDSWAVVSLVSQSSEPLFKKTKV